MPLQTVRNYFAERYQHIKQEWRNYQRSDFTTALPNITATDADLRRDFLRARNIHNEHESTSEYLHNEKQTINGFKLTDENKHEPFEFYTEIDYETVPENRLPKPGIVMLPIKYHKTNPVYATETVPETGFTLSYKLKRLLTTRYPKYLIYAYQYIRPLGTTDATFNDFNKEQLPIKPINEIRKQRALKLCHHFLNTKPYLPVHFVDYLHAKLPLSTGTGYFNRHSYKIRAHAKYAHPHEYHQKTTSKGYFLNSFLQLARTYVHHIKAFCLPFTPKADKTQNLNALRNFFLSHPTILFTRNHISDKDGALKQRPVYAVDDLFLCIETMLTFPLLVCARTIECCIMYGLETIRGGNHYLDHMAKKYKSYFTIDWSSFDQRMPRVITDIYYTDFLESLIIISQGYQATYEYPTYPDLTEYKMFVKMDNLLHFTHTWYNNMVFLLADGYAYLRTSAGIPSGMLNTQYCDSFCNLFLIIDGMIEFGLSDDDIREIVLFIMGDDNSGFTNWPITLLEKFIAWFELYAFIRYNMVLSKSKSVITVMRNKIETLSYKCNFGHPTRPIPKLVSQLCYPEHGPNDKFMSARAIGIAYAAAGCDPTFHNFCKDVYELYLPNSAPNTTETLNTILKHLPGQFKMLDAYHETIDLNKFPTLHKVRETYSTWQGPLQFTPKWNSAHFINTPDNTPRNFVTLLDYRLKHNIERRPVEQLFTV